MHKNFYVYELFTVTATDKTKQQLRGSINLMKERESFVFNFYLFMSKINQKSQYTP